MLKLNLKNLRKQAGLTQERFADLAGLTKSHLSEIENHKVPVNTVRLMKFAEVLKIDPRDLIDFGDPRDPIVQLQTAKNAAPMTVQSATAGPILDDPEFDAIGVSFLTAERGEVALLLSEPEALNFRQLVNDSLEVLAERRRHRMSSRA